MLASKEQNRVANKTPSKYMEEVKAQYFPKRQLKYQSKPIKNIANGQGRANRDEDMDFFAAYYKETFVGMKFL